MRLTLPWPKLPTIKVPSEVDVMLSGNTRVPGKVISVMAEAAKTLAVSATSPAAFTTK